jgi:hypothetical protein
MSQLTRSPRRTRWRPPARRVLPILLAIVAATGLLATPGGAAEVRAATPDLTIVSDARYAVQPDRHRVRVTLDLTLTNHLSDTKTTRYYFDRAYLAVLPGTSGFALSWTGGGSPSVHAAKKAKDYTVLRLNLGKRLYSGKTAQYTLQFDLVDKGGAATRDIRIGSSLVSFPVWAYASDSTPGSSVTVVFPSGYQVQAEAGQIPAPTTDAKGRTIFRTGKLAKPLTFFAFLVGDRPGAYTSTSVKPVLDGTPVELTIRSWPEDAAWRKRVGSLVGRALPVLREAIGLPWPRTGPLVVQEAVSRSTGGYAGLFDPAKGLIEVAYYANDFVVLHESAHSWFNGSLLADRWANEAFASYYGLDAASSLKVKAAGDVLTATLQKSRIPLNAWGALGRESAATEDYAYAAVLALARAIADRAGPDGLRAVWADAAGRVGAYQPPGPVAGAPELVDGAPDWRGLLDLLDARTGASFDDLWRSWVARDTDLPLLDARAAARARYDAVLDEARDWRLPRPIRNAMRAWRFNDATHLLDEASAVLSQRAEVERAATTAGLTPPAALRAAFEGNDGFADATAEAKAELQTIARYEDAVASRPTGDGPLLALGLWDETPEADLAGAREAFARGDLSGSAAAADDAAATWSGAAGLGQGRAVSLAVLAIAVLLTLLLIVAWVRGRRRRRHRMHAHLIKH